MQQQSPEREKTLEEEDKEEDKEEEEEHEEGTRTKKSPILTIPRMF